jgi:hypothetical protein
VIRENSLENREIQSKHGGIYVKIFCQLTKLETEMLQTSQRTSFDTNSGDEVVVIFCMIPAMMGLC